MRKVLISILLAGAAVSPALASPHNDDTDREQAREERAQAREERQQARHQSHEDRSSNVQRQSFARPERPDRPGPQQQSFDRQARIQQMETDRSARRDSRDVMRDDRRDQRQQVVEQFRDNRELRQSTRPTPHVLRTRVPVVSDVPRPGTHPPLRSDYHHATQPQWSTSWRNNSRYDWQNHRRHHRSWFHLGFYFDPFGWGHSPYHIGWRPCARHYNSR